MALTIADLFEDAADLCGDHTALGCGDDSLTYTEVDARSNRLASVLAARGVGPGDKVAVYCRNSIECVEAMLVVHKLRAFPDTLLIDSIGSSETGFGGMAMVNREQQQSGGPTVYIVKTNVVLDEQSKPLTEPASVGRIASSGHLPLEYYKDPAKSAATFVTYDGVRYALPGDLARIEGDGSVTLLGRGSNCINSGGEKVFPEEVEGALKAHDDVFDVLVVGVDDDRLGQYVGALIQPRQGGNITLDGLAEAARDTLARYKLPRSVWVVDFIRRSRANRTTRGRERSPKPSPRPSRGASST
jgi:acyl-CoA synthetase (AMP-forming)/AMP-acid ligase II